ncbi:FixH family protein [Labrys sp. KNU-23]|uniref:FixH family protein n=1 Tax=Labrys sp. KNU-23 TaxID=2789216 RepID=UPI0011F03577|nr:FixH family protein [Labrys sp. KNU-23]QEN86994.1 FixH family protein [Labrys sp. KNU-23]
MTSFRTNRLALAAVIGLACASASPARADIADYEFQLVQPEVKLNETSEIAVRLVDRRSGQPVPNAVIFAQRVDMAPDGMAGMKAPIEAIASDEPGIYRFKARLSMEGGWRLSLAAKLQGETGTLESRLVFRAVP